MKQILKQLVELRAMEQEEQVFIEAAYLMREANEIALDNGLDIEPVGRYITPAKAIAAVNRFLIAMEPEGYLLVKDAAKVLKVSPNTVLQWISIGRLRAINVGQPAKRPQYRIAREALQSLGEPIAEPQPRKKIKPQDFGYSPVDFGPTKKKSPR